MPSDSARTSTIRRTVVRPKLVSKKCTSGRRISRISTRLIRISLQQVSPRIRFPGETGDDQSFSEKFHQFSPDLTLQLAGAFRVFPRDAVEVQRNGDIVGGFFRRSVEWLAGQSFFRPSRFNPPLRNQSVGRQPLLEAALDRPIVIRKISPADGAQTLDVEKGIFRPHRVETPLDRIQPGRKRSAPLRALQGAAKAAVFVTCADTERKRMPVIPAPSPGRHRRDKATAFSCPRERSEHLPADLIQIDKQAKRINFQVRVAPDLLLELHATGELL